MPTKSLKDMIYFDAQKLSSLLSQFEGGILSEIELETEQTKGNTTGGGVKIPLISAETEVAREESSRKLHKGLRHHELVEILENHLYQDNLLANINANDDVNTLKEKIQSHSFVKIQGYCCLYDYQYISKIVENFNEIGRFIARSKIVSDSNLKQIFEEHINVTQQNSPRKPSKPLNEADVIDLLIKDYLPGLAVDNWLASGIKNIITSLLLQSSYQLYILPYPASENFFVAPIKPNCFTDSDINIFKSTYGDRPTFQLTILGLVTSIPDVNQKSISTTTDFFDNSSEHAIMKAFAQIFDSFQDVSKLFNIIDAPNAVKIYPISVYREISSKIQG